MLLNEHKSKILFEKAGIPVPQGVIVFPGEEADFKPGFALPWFLKSQVLVGGRGKAGAILRIDDADDFPEAAVKLFRLDIKGETVPFIRVEPGAMIEREFYLSLTVSRERKCILLTVGREGGVEIENHGKDNLFVQEVALPGGLAPNQIRAAFFHLGLEKSQLSSFGALLTSLFKGMLDNGLLMAEINPLITTPDGEFLALDGKVEIDDNYVDLNPGMDKYYQEENSTPEENKARDAGLSFVKLSGWVGLMVNGAGLAMATMDMLNFSKLPASNFLDLGGAADQKRMEIALELLFGDTQAKAVFINLFGGILSCEKVALAMKGALAGAAPPKPLVVRMSGKDAESGLEILKNLHVDNLHMATDMQEAIATLKTLKPKAPPAVDFPAPMDSPLGKAPKNVGYRSSALFDIDKDTPILVQGITGREGQLHTRLMLEYGANVVAGVTPFKGGQEVLGVPVYNSIAEAKRCHHIGASIIFVPPRMAADAVAEAAGNEIPWVICITEGIVQHDMLTTFEQIKRSPTRVIGPNTPGLIVPGQTKIGILPTTPFTDGPVAILSRSGTLTYEVADRLTSVGIGQSLCVGIGGDPFIGINFIDMFEMIRNHDKTKAVIVLGEIGGQAEENLAEYVVRTGFDKPVISFIAGQTAPPGKRLGHAGAILDTGGGIESKLKTMSNAGFAVCPSLEAVTEMTSKALRL
ncbi:MULTISPECIES: succinate--CoA ligase subunit alpha [unclassified Pseudodesulfovibrio]|uniref:succinate--CoA ligase subunit alpha n=1 Tax=unclassified Pseudodesulfovibrio TaxID=2661612 RepID=UPI000FEC0FBF|nr:MULTISPECIES: succinate--CoA ligase subunit alpha [unclassified Pseudodesulfovibrio]MCJ2163803.1 succinate--CoA ligase subunit alpha [Pseudodesulfovibrio sp. S3-i]RWU05949.1 succinate--CoA ligase subunit alpha [Pseudodesulfovibrio sp. S3]